MTQLHTLLSRAGLFNVANCPDGADSLLLAQACSKQDLPVLFVARDEARMARVSSNMAFFAPDLNCVELPAWDCLPYDRVSPNSDIVARRLAALSLLASDQKPDLVVTTLHALTQKLPARALMEKSALTLKVGHSMPQDRLMAFFSHNGYHRSGTVREAGEFAIRGGIIDIFPSGLSNPVRLDFFGDELESIKSFDAVNQRSLDKMTGLDLHPVSEISLDEESIRRFRKNYRDHFGAITDQDPLYEAVSEGRKHPGMEHWLPFFHNELDSLFTYLPDSPIFLDHQSEEALLARDETVADYYQARQSILEATPVKPAHSSGQDSALTYKPCPPDLLYLNKNAVFEALSHHPSFKITPYDIPESDQGLSFDMGGELVQDFTLERKKPDQNIYEALKNRILSHSNKITLIAAYTDGARDRFASLLEEHGLASVVSIEAWSDLKTLKSGQFALCVLELEKGFASGDVVTLTEQDILGERLARPRRKKRRGEEFISEVSALEIGDLVVHVDHGIGRYNGLETLDVNGAPHDCLRVLYAGDDKLYVPVENIEMLSRFGSEDSHAQLDKLGGVAWQARKAKIKERIRDIADKLIKIAAERQLKKGEIITAPEGLYDEFCARFKYIETDDQLRAIGDVSQDMASGQAMDRLVCGDVGFGKTEVALRASFLAAMAGLQVAVVVPTTLLARQHYKQFAERFEGLPVNVAQLSRLVAGKAAKAVKEGLADGTIDIVVGTHAVLAKTVNFKNLGLLIVDEEQHFGVTQKERLKQLRANIHVLTLTATPIPRTLQMALTGVRELSIIATPPVDRLAVRSFVLPYDGVVLKEAILREHYRGGQIFYVCPRLADLDRVYNRLRELVPDIKIAVAHGQMAATQLENVMNEFVDGQADLLLATNIIESGLDIPRANTMIIHRSDMFGLSQLYQLRGRIGRSKIRAYCYFTIPPGRVLTDSAKKRLDVMQTLDTLGAGFTLASHDLDIRGAGNLLGDEQSGHVKEVGVELYQQMLEEAVAAAKEDMAEQEIAETWSPNINIGSAVLIPETYVEDLSVRLGLYRRLSDLKNKSELDAFAVEMVDRFGSMPKEVENLLEVVAIKQICKMCNIAKMDAGPKGGVITFRHDQFANPAGLIGYLQKHSGTAKLRPDHKLVVTRNWEDPTRRLKGVIMVMKELAALVRETSP